MIHPFEIADKYVVTPIRVLLAHKLREKGYSQLQISKILGISQPTINMYFRSSKYSVDNMYRRLMESGLNRSEIEGVLNTLAQMLIDNQHFQAMKTILSLSQRLLVELKLCDLHRRHDARIPSDCRLCEDLFMLSKENLILAELWDTYEKLSRDPHIHLLVPEVLMNIAYSKENPETLNDIAAFPGRITRVGDTIIAFSKPAWGASRHLASILLKISRDGGVGSHRVVANIKVDRCVEEALSKLNIEFADVRGDKSLSEEDIIDQVASEVIKSGGRIKAVIHRGGRGYEPITYIFASSPYELVYYLLSIARECGKKQGSE